MVGGKHRRATDRASCSSGDQHDDWAIAERRSLSEESMAAIDRNPDEITTTTAAALPAA